MKTRHSYFTVMIDYGRRGREAVTNPEHTRRDIVDMLRAGEWSKPVAFIHYAQIDENGLGTVEDVTNELLAEAGFYEGDRALNRTLERVARELEAV